MNSFICLIPSFLLFVLLTLSWFENGQPAQFIRNNLMWLILPIIFLNGAIYALLMPYWSPIDEQEHFAYIEQISETKSLPLLTDLVSNQVMALRSKTYPGQPQVLPAQAGFVGQQYEAFQPPLYYVASVAVYRLAGSNFINKLFLLRIWGVAQLLIVVFLAHRIFANICGIFSRKRLFLEVVGLSLIGMTPSMIGLSATIGNNVFTIIFVGGILLWLSHSFRENRTPRLADALVLGTLTAAAVLSRFLLIVVIPLVLIYFLWKRKNIIANSVMFVMVVALLMAPWLYFNHEHYGSFTANGQAKLSQMPIINPNANSIGYNYIRTNVKQAVDDVWILPPGEINWSVFRSFNRISSDLSSALDLIWLSGMVVSGIAVLAAGGKRNGRLKVVIQVSLVTVVANFIFLAVASIVTDWPILLGRYMQPAIFGIAFFFMYLLYRGARIRFLAPAIIGAGLLPLALNVIYVQTFVSR
jgi:hypothetical protein